MLTLKNGSLEDRLVPLNIMVILALTPILVFLFMIHMQPQLQSKEVLAKYGTLYTDLRTNTAFGYGYTFLYLARRTVYGLSIGLLSSNPGLQIFIQMLISLSLFAYVVLNQPFVLPYDN
jgi:hypothetical protein